MTEMLPPSRWSRVTLWSALGLAVLLGFYSAAGFLLAPYLLQNRLWPMLAEQTGGQWGASQVAFNPFTLRLRVQGFSLSDPTGRDLVTVSGIEAQIDARQSLRQKALVAAASLQAPQVSVELGKDGKPNFAFLLRPSDKKPSGEAATVPPFHVVRLSVEQGTVNFADRSQAQDFQTVIAPLNFTLENLSSVPGESARFSLSAQGEHHDELRAQGTLGIAPLVSEGEIALKGVRLAPLAPYLAALAPYLIRDGKLSLGVSYRLRADDSEMRFELPAAQAEAKDLALSEGESESFLKIAGITAAGFTLQPDLEHLRLSTLSIRELGVRGGAQVAEGDAPSGIRIGAVEMGDIALALKEKSLTVERIASDAAELTAWIAPEGAFRMPGMLPPASPAPAPATPAQGELAWNIRIGAIDLREYKVSFTDFSVTPPVQLQLAPINLSLKDFSSKSGTEFKIRLETGLGRSGRAEVEGKVILRPLLIADLRVAVERLGLGRFQPYLENFVQLKLNRGRLNVAGDFDFFQGPVNSIRFSGQAGVTGLATIEKRSGKDLVRWKDLQLNGLIFETIPKRLSIREVLATEPYANVVIGEEGKVNITQALSGQSATRPGPKPTKAPPPRAASARESKAENREALQVVIGALRIARGQADFADLTLKPINFAVGIHELNGNVRGLSSQEDAKADILLEGKLDQNSPVKIIGQINPFSMGKLSDITMQFRGVNLTTLSPYSGKFAGYRIEKGKMSMDLRYRLDDSQLVADNRFVLDQLKLGERVESPEATSLPVKLAVALLKDANGQIDLELPITGNLKDPQVSIRSLLANAITELVTKLVRAPFALLGGLVGDGGEDLGAVSFEAGSSQLNALEKEKLVKVSKALKERPGLSLEIKGEVNPERDRRALAERELMRQLKTARRLELRIQGTPVRSQQEVELSDEDYRRLFTEYCRAKTPYIPEIQALSASDEKLLSGEPLEAAKQRVLEKWSVDELELRSLAQARGQTVRDYFVKETGLSPARIYLLDVRFTEPDAKEIKAMLSLSGS